MRVGFTGSHGVGKTTLAGSLHEALHLPLLTGVSHSFSDIEESKGRDLLVVPQLHLFSSFLQLHLSTPHFIADRTIIETLAYARVNKLPSWTLFLIESVLRAYISLYDVIFFIPIEFEVEATTHRSGDLEIGRAHV